MNQWSASCDGFYLGFVIGALGMFLWFVVVGYARWIALSSPRKGRTK